MSFETFVKIVCFVGLVVCYVGSHYLNENVYLKYKGQGGQKK